MNDKIIERGAGEIKVKLEINDRYNDTLLTMINGHQWTGSLINKTLAVLVIAVLEEYISDESEETKTCKP